jgi:hypothetical protein
MSYHHGGYVSGVSRIQNLGKENRIERNVNIARIQHSFANELTKDFEEVDDFSKKENTVGGRGGGQEVKMSVSCSALLCFAWFCVSLKHQVLVVFLLTFLCPNWPQ